MNLEDYISYIQVNGANGGEKEGVGFFVGNLFITAGHVIKDCNDFIIYHKGVTYNLNKSDAKSFSYMGDNSIASDGYDIAIFKIDGIKSPLTLSSELPQSDKDLQTVTKRKHVVSNGKSIFDRNEIIQLHSFGTKVVEIKDNLLGCTAEYLIKGDSGSPVLNGDKVYGVLIAGQPGTDVCVFQSSNSIIEIIKDIEYE